MRPAPPRRHGRRRRPPPPLGREPRLVPGRLRLGRARRPRRRGRGRRRRDRPSPQAQRLGGLDLRRPAAPDPERGRLERPERPDALAARSRRLDGRPRSPRPRRTAESKPLALAAGAVRDGLPQVGVLDSSSLREPPPRLLRRLQRRLRGPRRRQPGARYRSCTRLRRRLRPASRALTRRLRGAPRLFGPAFVVEKENICNIFANQVGCYAGIASGSPLPPHSVVFTAHRGD